ncbi:MAG: Asp-tRNA(Asn)/Glu-tRNA(Gln) amidotransferase subunit GatA [Candidatus Micrarchaeota archaeon]|nr:Asp-tRNA(Asn)/Glu-tRNA(Gln) amidotransferase subunit GatA [Candidatus Micrarchaeota archaeon]
MSGSIEEFHSKKAGDGYYERLEAELKKLNAELHAFNNITLLNTGGYPFSAKDNLCVEGVETTASSRILKGYVPPFNATAVERLLKRKFTFIGKTNMDEFGFGTFGLNSDEPARNPFNREYVTGGSSSGAAVATSVMKYHVALAVSTGGSISAPSSFCGVVGFTPTYGLVSRYGLLDYGNSLDKIGIISRSASDTANVFDLIRGPDDKDSTSVSEAPKKEKAKKNLFVIKELLKGETQSYFERFCDKLRGLGYAIGEVSVPDIEKAVQAYYIISMAEASTNLAKYTGFKYGYKNSGFEKGYNEFFTEARSNFGVEAKRRIVLGTFVRSSSVRSKYYDKAMKVRALLTSRLSKTLEKGNIIIPAMPILTPKIEEARQMDSVSVYKMDISTIPPNLCGLPHVCFPYDYAGGMPIGAQIIGSHFSDNGVLEFVQEWEKTFKYKFKYDVGAL